MSDFLAKAAERGIRPFERNTRWRNIIFFAVTHLTAIIGVPVYLARYGGVPSGILWLSAFYFAATGLAVTVGYHRLFSHRTYEAGNVIRFLALLFGAASFEETALTWSSNHRVHHQYVDTELDPYNIKQGFFHAHMGWMMFWKGPENLPCVKDLKASRLVMHQHNHYIFWGSAAGIVAPILIGAAMGYPFAAFIFAFCARITLVYQGTFCINSVCHTFGKSTYDIDATARDNWFNALFTWGEGYHNFHHRFPNDYRNGVRWFDWDPSKWIIALLGMTGLAYNVKRTSSFTIMNARILAENRLAERHLLQAAKRRAQVAEIRQRVGQQYEHVVNLLHEWENHLKKHTLLKKELDAGASLQPVESSLAKLKQVRKQFLEARKEWLDLVSYKIYLPSVLPLPA